MPARLTLICHAATAATHAGRFPADEDLDREGLDALAAVGILKLGRWLSAPEGRTQRTALALSGLREVAVEQALRDWDLGRWAGCTPAQMTEGDAAALAAWRTDPAAAPHGGESLDTFSGRVATFLDGVARRGGRVAAVTHPAVVRAAIATALGAGPTAFWHLDAPPLARARLSHDGRRWVLQALTPPGR